MPLKEWRDDAPDLWVRPLTERESPIAASFKKPQVQYIGSTSQCGCDFPNVMLQGGEWPWADGEPDADSQALEWRSREGLVALLRQTAESTVELYGVWDGDFDFTTPPVVREEILLDLILQPDFRFKEGGFYLVTVTSSESTRT
jgi:hypothetical protein